MWNVQEHFWWHIELTRPVSSRPLPPLLPENAAHGGCNGGSCRTPVCDGRNGTHAAIFEVTKIVGLGVLGRAAPMCARMCLVYISMFFWCVLQSV